MRFGYLWDIYYDIGILELLKCFTICFHGDIMQAVLECVGAFGAADEV